MTPFQKIKGELSLPTYLDFYDGTDQKYVVVTTIMQQPLTGDADDEAFITTVDVDLYSKKDPTSDKKAVRKALRKLGFAIAEINHFYEENEEYYHINFRCEIEETEE